MSRIFGFGSATLDFRISTADFGDTYRDKLLARETKLFGGGSAANTLVQAARLSAQASWLGKLGSDWIGNTIVSGLEEDGVDCSHAFRDAAACSPFNVAVYAEWRRVGGYLLPNALGTLSRHEAERLASVPKPGNWCIVEIGEIPLDAVHAFCQAAVQRGVRLVIDVDLDPVRQCVGDPSLVGAILRCADVLAPNRVAFRSLYGDIGASELVDALVAEYGVSVVITSGADGAYYRVPGQPTRHVPAIPVEVVDTVGAGDAFHGGLLYALSCGQSLEEAVLLGAKCGAAACLKFGARSSMPTMEELTALFPR